MCVASYLDMAMRVDLAVHVHMSCDLTEAPTIHLLQAVSPVTCFRRVWIRSLLGKTQS